jgi:hypothetical protein
MRYYLTIDQTGHSEGFAVCTGNHQMAYLEYNDEVSEKGAEADAELIVDSLNAYSTIPQLLKALTLIGNACSVQANLNSTATQGERDRFINSVFDTWNRVVVPAIENGTLDYDGKELNINQNNT